MHGTMQTTRITPAHAGKSMTGAGIAHNAWDHPRTCGEKRVLCYIEKAKEGSPPHMRGKAFVNPRAYPAFRITPAHAGKRSGGWSAGLAVWDHPRTCGEKGGQLYLHVVVVGSPPHMRGKVLSGSCY